MPKSKKKNNPQPNRRELFSGTSALATAALLSAQPASGQNTTNDIAGKSVLITGTSSGFGRRTSLHLARNGARVVASMRNFQNGQRLEAQELRDIAADEGLKLSVVEIDVTDPALVASGVAQAQEITNGKLDVLVNNAGIGFGGPVEMHDEEALLLQFQTNLFGYHRMANAVLPQMRKRGQGQLIQISSQLGRIILPNIGMYCATKFGMEAMFEALAYELAPHGIDVCIIQPGGYPTKIWDNGRAYFSDLLERSPSAKVEAYDHHLQLSRSLMSGAYQTDPMDVARAIYELISLPQGKRPLRRPVHTNTQLTEMANQTHAKIQSFAMGDGSYADWYRAVTD